MHAFLNHTNYLCTGQEIHVIEPELQLLAIIGHILEGNFFLELRVLAVHDILCSSKFGTRLCG